jgi:hypothetical protein
MATDIPNLSKGMKCLTVVGVDGFEGLDTIIKVSCWCYAKFIKRAFNAYAHLVCAGT